MRNGSSRRYNGIRIVLLCGVLLLSACGNRGPDTAVSDSGREAQQQTQASPEEQAKERALAIRMPEASGTLAIEQDGLTVDASHTEDGYVMAKSDRAGAILKVIVQNGAGSSTYDLPSDGEYVTYPLQHGNGAYTLTVYENVEGNLYAPLLSTPFSVELADELTPYLYPNQYVNYRPGDEAVLRSFLLVEEDTRARNAVRTLYRFVADAIAYDYDKAATVGTGYLPVPDETLASGTGICFDYASLLATMLRVQEVPTQLVIGYVAPDNAYHAWNLAYVDGEWTWMDATFDGERKESAYTVERFY